MQFGGKSVIDVCGKEVDSGKKKCSESKSNVQMVDNISIVDIILPERKSDYEQLKISSGKMSEEHREEYEMKMEQERKEREERLKKDPQNCNTDNVCDDCKPLNTKETNDILEGKKINIDNLKKFKCKDYGDYESIDQINEDCKESLNKNNEKFNPEDINKNAEICKNLTEKIETLCKKCYEKEYQENVLF